VDEEMLGLMSKAGYWYISWGTHWERIILNVKLVQQHHDRKLRHQIFIPTGTDLLICALNSVMQRTG
jgi:hypothetical protein